MGGLIFRFGDSICDKMSPREDELAARSKKGEKDCPLSKI